MHLPAVTHTRGTSNPLLRMPRSLPQEQRLRSSARRCRQSGCHSSFQICRKNRRALEREFGLVLFLKIPRGPHSVFLFCLLFIGLQNSRSKCTPYPAHRHNAEGHKPKPLPSLTKDHKLFFSLFFSHGRERASKTEQPREFN